MAATATTAHQPPPTTESPAAAAEDMEQIARRRRRLMLGAILAGVSIALLLGYFWKNHFMNKKEEQTGVEKVTAGAGADGWKAALFDKSGDVTDPTVAPPTESPEALLKLAKSAKEAGLMIMGVTQCGWTRRQREMFGGASSPARKVIESIYIECRDRSMCPNVRGYPTWVRGDQQYPGFKDPAKLRALIAEVKPQPLQPMLRQASEPVEENIPDVEAQADAAPDPSAVKAEEQASKALAVLLNGVAIPSGLSVGDTNGAGTGKMPKASRPRLEVVEEEEEEEVPQEMEKGKKVENVRGVSAYPPLAPPVMPGTAAFQLQESIADNQLQQGNVPRLSLANSDPVFELAQQMASTFRQIAIDQGRNPNSSQYSDCNFPQSSTISTGEALDDKRIYTETND